MKKLSKKTKEMLLWGLVGLAVLGLLIFFMAGGKKYVGDNRSSMVRARMGKAKDYMVCINHQDATDANCNACLKDSSQCTYETEPGDMLKCCGLICDVQTDDMGQPVGYSNCDVSRQP